MDIHTIYSKLEQENSQLKNQIRDVRMELEGIQRKYQLRYQNSPIPYVTINCHGDILEFNNAACVFFGRKAERLCMDNLMEFLDADSKGQVGLFLQMISEERLRKQLEVSDLEINFFVRGRRCETVVHYSFIFQRLELFLELAIWDVSDTNETRRQLKKEYECYEIALQTSVDYIFEYDQLADELREYGDFKRPDIPKTERIIKKHFLRDVEEHQREMTSSYQLMRDIFLGNQVSGELNLSEIDYYNFNGWAYLEVASFGDIFSESRIIGRIRDITEEKIKEFKENEIAYRDQLTGLYHSEYALNILIKKLESGKLQGRQDHLLFLSMDTTAEIEKNYGFTFFWGMIYIIGNMIKMMKEKEGAVAIRTGNQEFVLLIEDRTKEEAIAITNALLKSLRTQYCGNERNGMITYRAVLRPSISWNGYPDWNAVIQDMYHTGMGTRQHDIYLKNGKIEEKFCQEVPIKMQHYRGTSQLYHTKQKPIFSYAYDLFEKTKDMETAIYLLINLVGILKKLNYICIYELNKVYLSRHVLYEWSLKDKRENEPEVLYYPSEKVWKEQGKWKGEEGEYQCLSYEEEQQGKVLDWNLGTSFEDSSKMLCFGEPSGDYKEMILYGFPKEKSDWTEEEVYFFKDFSKILLIGLNQKKVSSLSTTKSIFLARMSHEIRTPISGISGTIDLLRKSLNDGEEGKKEKLNHLLYQMEESVAKLLKVTDSILDMAQIENFSMELLEENFQMAEVLNNIADRFAKIAKEKGVVFQYENNSLSNHELKGDIVRLGQVVANLLDNAIKFTRTGGTILFRIHSKKEGRNREIYEMEICDNGCGILKENQEMIFQTFVKTEQGNAVDGMGLGLSISQALVKLMGGSLQLSSELDIGTTVKVTIPFKIGTKRKSKQKESEQNVLNGIRLLLVEDNELNAMIVEEILSLEGVQVEVASNGKTAVSMFKEHKAGYYQLILMDLRMPNMDGFETTRAIRSLEREDSKTVLILALSAEIFEKNPKKLAEIGLDGYLTKPLKVERLKQIIFEKLGHNAG